MREIKSLVEKAKKYLRSAEILRKVIMNLRFQEPTMRCFTVHKQCCSRKIYHFPLIRV